MVLLLLAAALAQDVPAPTPTIPSLVEAGNAAYLKGDYDSALEFFRKAWDVAQSTPADDPVRYDLLKRLTRIRAAAGDFQDADNYLQMAINWRENIFGQNDPKIADDLLLSVQYCRGLKNFDRALAILTRVMGIHRITSGGTETAVFADDLSRMAQVHMEKKNVPAAIAALRNAIEIRTKLGGPLDPSLIYDLDRLAGAHIVVREYDKAEAAYRHTLVIRETLLGKNDADLIATVDGIAYACFGQKKFDEAEPVYRRLIELWVTSVGEDHPMVAIALDKVATFYAAQKKFEQAKEATDRATAIRAHFLASGLSVAATEQIAEGNKDGAIALYQRALAIMDPPHPIFEELRTQMDGIVKAMSAPPPKAPAAKKPAPAKAVPAKK
jgi:tetratricopeptide (TPR) repeat protein